MNPLQTNMLRALAGAVLVIAAAGGPGLARADAFAQSILVIDNFRLLHANGTPYTASDFPMLGGTVDARASGQFNGVFANGAQSAAFGSAASLDVAQQHVGGGVPARPENNFNRFPDAPLATGSFGYGDQFMAGNIITTNLGAAGALIEARADAALAANGAASGGSGIGTAATFSFSLGIGDFMTVAFDALPFTRAFVNRAAGASGSASAQLSWNITLLDLSTGATVFSFSPEGLNSLADVSRTDGADGESSYDPGWLAFAATTDMLAVGDVYQLTIAQSTLASTLQSQRVPEPGTLAIFGAGLLAMAVLGRRRRTGGSRRTRPAGHF